MYAENTLVLENGLNNLQNYTEKNVIIQREKKAISLRK